MIEVRLFGNLRRYAPGRAVASGTAIHLPLGEAKTVGHVLDQVGIDPAEVGNVFLNGYLLPRSIYPITLGYPLAAHQPLTLGEYLDTRIQTGDRLGIFPHNMSLVVV